MIGHVVLENKIICKSCFILLASTAIHSFVMSLLITSNFLRNTIHFATKHYVGTRITGTGKGKYNIIIHATENTSRVLSIISRYFLMLEATF